MSWTEEERRMLSPGSCLLARTKRWFYAQAWRSPATGTIHFVLDGDNDRFLGLQLITVIIVEDHPDPITRVALVMLPGGDLLWTYTDGLECL